MCDFQPGDELMCVAPVNPRLGTGSALSVGAAYTCEAVYIEPHTCPCGSDVAVEVIERPEDVYCECHFAKRPGFDLSAWLATTNTIEEPKRTPTKVPA